MENAMMLDMFGGEATVVDNTPVKPSVKKKPNAKRSAAAKQGVLTRKQKAYAQNMGLDESLTDESLLDKELFKMQDTRSVVDTVATKLGVSSKGKSLADIEKTYFKKWDFKSLNEVASIKVTEALLETRVDHMAISAIQEDPSLLDGQYENVRREVASLIALVEKQVRFGKDVTFESFESGILAENLDSMIATTAEWWKEVIAVEVAEEKRTRLQTAQAERIKKSKKAMADVEEDLEEIQWAKTFAQVVNELSAVALSGSGKLGRMFQRIRAGVKDYLSRELGRAGRVKFIAKMITQCYDDILNAPLDPTVAWQDDKAMFHGAIWFLFDEVTWTNFVEFHEKDKRTFPNGMKVKLGDPQADITEMVCKQTMTRVKEWYEGYNYCYELSLKDEALEALEAIESVQCADEKQEKKKAKNLAEFKGQLARAEKFFALKQKAING